MEPRMPASRTCGGTDDRSGPPSMAWLVLSEVVAMGLLLVVGLGSHYSEHAMGIWFPDGSAAAQSVAGWPMAVAATWPVLHLGAWVVAGLSRHRFGRHLPEVLLVGNLVCAPVLLFYAWLPLASPIITEFKN